MVQNKPVIEFIFDFASPNAYLVAKVLPAIAERHGASIAHVPCLLGGIFRATGNQAPMMAFAGVKGKLAYDMLEMRRFIARHGLTRFAMNPHFPVNTLLVMRGMIAAEEMGVADAYRDAVLAGMWENGLKLDEPDVLAGVLDAAGIDAAKLITLTQDAAIKERLIANTDAAVARGTFGIPTIFVGDEMFFGKERLGQIDDLLAGQLVG